MKKILYTLMLLLLPMIAKAYDFEVDGIYYKKLSGNEVEVTYKAINVNGYLESTVFIPSSVVYNGILYSVVAIGDFAFGFDNEILSISLPNSITSIGGNGFAGCLKLQSITIPSSVTSISRNTFNNCSSLTSIKVENGNAMYDSRNNCNAIIKTSSNKLIVGCKNTEVPTNVTTIGDHAFYGNASIKSLSIPNSVLYFEDYAFGSCENLENIELPNKLQVIGQGCFGHCSNLKSLSIPQSLVSIGDFAFTDCIGLVSIKVDEGNMVYDSRNNCNALIESSSNSLILGCINTNIPSTIKSISRYAFMSLPFTETIVLPEGLESIDNSAFYKSTLKVITLPNSLKTIGDFAFSDCTYLSKVVSEIKLPFRISSYVFRDISTNANLYVPRDTKTKYMTTSGWKDNFDDIFENEDVIAYTLTIQATGNGSATYDGSSVKKGSNSFSVNSGQNATITFTPDNGYRVANVKVNNADVTSVVSNNQYTISNITSNTTLEVTFEPKTHLLNFTALGNGSISYNSITIRNQTQIFTVNEGESATVSFVPDGGYRIASVKVNDNDVTSSVTNSQYTISNISANTTLSVTFEAIPATTYTLSITASGNGNVTYNGTTIRGNTQSYTVTDGESATVSLVPDGGYRIASVKVNNNDVTSSVTNNQYAISNITANTTLSVIFEAIPATTYTLSITASGNGSAMYSSTTIRNQTQSFTVNGGTSATISFVSDYGYRVASVKMNNADVTSKVTNNRYTISNITANTTLSVIFEAIPATTYSLSITASGNGSASYGNATVRNQTRTFTVEEGTAVSITFSPDNGNSVGSVKVDGADVTAQAAGNRYTISNMSKNTTLTVAFQEDVNALTVAGVNYMVTSQTAKTVKVAGGNYGQVLTVPATVTQNGTTWAVTGIDADALKDYAELAAVIWNPEADFTATVSNPNLLLYVTAEEYAPAAIKNVVVNGIASSISLVDAASGNNFYCPQAFTAQKISYIHNYGMTTGIGESRGWETLALPFDVQTVSHASKGTIVPFANWRSGDSSKPFWLYELTGTGFAEAGSIKAYTPYIISMPNNPQYDSQWLLKGSVTFAANSVTIAQTEDLNTASYQGRTFVPNFAGKGASEGLYALNVVNDYVSNNSGMTEGSKFVLNMRRIYPFEAYMTIDSNAAPYAFGVFEDMIMAIREVDGSQWTVYNEVYDLQGRKLANPVKKGVYIRNGKKLIVK